MPVPSAVISVPICSLDSILSVRTRSTLRILPRSGSTAWNSRLRPCLALPPAESPSTMKSSDLAGILFLAVGELARQRGDAERILARQLARLARGLARRRGLDHLADDHLGLRRMLLEPGLQRLVDDVLDHRADFGGDQLVLGLRRELRVGHLHRQHGGQALAAIVAGERDLFLFRVGLGIAVDLARQRAAEAGEMRAAVALRDVVGEAQHVLMVAVVPPQRRLDADAVRLRAHHDRARARSPSCCGRDI